MLLISDELRKQRTIEKRKNLFFGRFQLGLHLGVGVNRRRRRQRHPETFEHFVVDLCRHFLLLRHLLDGWSEKNENRFQNDPKKSFKEVFEFKTDILSFIQCPSWNTWYLIGPLRARPSGCQDLLWRLVTWTPAQAPGNSEVDGWFDSRCFHFLTFLDSAAKCVKFC